MTKALVALANGVEEMEAVIAIDTFRRAGWEVVAAGIRDGLVGPAQFFTPPPDPGG